jgi:predicted Zn-dependent peptidase
MDLLVHTLTNGIRLIHRHIPNAVAHFGVFIAAGTRHEREKEHGIAHFIEHTIFKGTEKRNVFQVLNRLENVGADLNAYTSKEETCFYATFLHEYYERTLELFNDILFHSVFPEKELEKEKQVVMEEIRSYQDNPSEQIFDDFEDMVFAGHPLGKNILGTARSLKLMKRKDILDFMRNNYRPEEIVLVSVGDIQWKRMVHLADKYFNVGFPDGQKVMPFPFSGYEPEEKSVKKKTWQVHCILGSVAYPYSHEQRIPMALLNNMLGGPVMNSRLSLALRERNGLTYQCESNYTPYSDSGIISIYFGTDQSLYPKALEIIHKELDKLRTQKLTKIQLHTVQKQLIGQLAIAQESNLGQMLVIGKSFLLQNKFDPIETIIDRIRSTTAEELIAIANEVFDPAGLSMLTFRTSSGP